MSRTFRRCACLLVAGLATRAVAAQPLVIDHEAVELYDDIPGAYIDAVKKMWVSVAGESHSAGYRIGTKPCWRLRMLGSR